MKILQRIADFNQIVPVNAVVNKQNTVNQRFVFQFYFKFRLKEKSDLEIAWYQTQPAQILRISPRAERDFFSIEIQFLNLSILAWSCVKIQHDFKLCSFWLKNCIWRWIKNNLFEALMEWFQANNFKNSIEWKFYWFFSRSIKLLEYWPCNVYT